MSRIHVRWLVCRTRSAALNTKFAPSSSLIFSLSEVDASEAALDTLGDGPAEDEGLEGGGKVDVDALVTVALGRIRWRWC